MFALVLWRSKTPRAHVEIIRKGHAAPFTGFEYANLHIYNELPRMNNAEAVENRVPKTISIDPEILARGLGRAAQFRLNFSRYIEWLIDQDYDSGATRMVIVAEPPPEPPR
jgi:hypothetical protein